MIAYPSERKLYAYSENMFYLFYKGYETFKEIEIINNLLKIAKEKGLLFGKLDLLKADKR